ncbi:MAG: hypothetical protein IPJ13_07970 [Saprospiraceae bacterium]|nr:hypothetical protein [Saprospiraceae bacterium]
MKRKTRKRRGTNPNEAGWCRKLRYDCYVLNRHKKGVIWTGSDDGLVYLTKDGGKPGKM